ncbi:MAG: Rieske (2Fe-2S) protein [Deltaproteobacteria bacterium]|nr:Rieske (2Fe-2S) protein [Deltaproteobacteria bacterium]
MIHNWQHNWYYLADESEILTRGDFKTLVISEQPVIVVRSEDGQVRVLFNICRHRDVMVCHEERGNATRFVCPFHGWVYNTKGNLMGLSSAGEMARTFSERHGLKPVPRMGIVRGCIFASLNSEGEDLESYLKRTKFFEGKARL